MTSGWGRPDVLLCHTTLFLLTNLSRNASIPHTNLINLMYINKLNLSTHLHLTNTGIRLIRFEAVCVCTFPTKVFNKNKVNKKTSNA